MSHQYFQSIQFFEVKELGNCFFSAPAPNFCPPNKNPSLGWLSDFFQGKSNNSSNVHFRPCSGGAKGALYGFLVANLRQQNAGGLGVPLLDVES